MACGLAVGGVSQVIDRVLEGQRLQTSLLTDGHVQWTPHLRGTLRPRLFGRSLILMSRGGWADGVGVGVV